MALVFPIVSDPDQPSDAPPTNSWELDTNGYSIPYGDPTSDLRTHNGQFVFQYKFYASTVDVYRQGAVGWSTLGQLKNKSDANTFYGGDIISWDGDLYALFSEYKSSSGDTTMKAQVARWNETTSAWVYETTATDGLQPSGYHYRLPDGGQGTSGCFVVHSGDLYAIFFERTGSNVRVAVNKRDGGSWTRSAASGTITGSISGGSVSSSAISCDGAIWFQAGDSIFRFDGSSVSRVATQSTYLTVSGMTTYDERLFCRGGVPSLAYYTVDPTSPYNYSDGNQYFYLASTTDGGSSWSITQRTRPLSDTGTSRYNWANYFQHNGSDYVLISGKGPGVTTSGNVGKWAYRLDGSTWTQLGGGQMRGSTSTDIGNDFAPIVRNGAIYYGMLYRTGSGSTSDPNEIFLYRTAA